MLRTAVMTLTLILVLVTLVAISPSQVRGSSNASVDIDVYGKVVYVVDGDTIDVMVVEIHDTKYSSFLYKKIRIRFADINAPEIYTYKGKQAKQFLYSLIHGKYVYLDIDDLYTYDKYGRVVAVVYLPINSTHLLNVNLYLVLKGYAEIDDYPNQFNPYRWRLHIRYPQSVVTTVQAKHTVSTPATRTPSIALVENPFTIPYRSSESMEITLYNVSTVCSFQVDYTNYKKIDPNSRYIFIRPRFGEPYTLYAITDEGCEALWRWEPPQNTTYIDAFFYSDKLYTLYMTLEEPSKLHYVVYSLSNGHVVKGSVEPFKIARPSYVLDNGLYITIDKNNGVIYALNLTSLEIHRIITIEGYKISWTPEVALPPSEPYLHTSKIIVSVYREGQSPVDSCPAVVDVTTGRYEVYCLRSLWGEPIPVNRGILMVRYFRVALLSFNLSNVVWEQRLYSGYKYSSSSDMFVAIFSDAIIARFANAIYLIDYGGNVLSCVMYQPPEVAVIETRISAIAREAIAWKGGIPVYVGYDRGILYYNRVYISDLYGNTLATFKLNSTHGYIDIYHLFLVGNRSGYTLVLVYRSFDKEHRATSSDYILSILRLEPVGRVTVPVIVKPSIISTMSTLTKTVTRTIAFTRTLTVVKPFTTTIYTGGTTVRVFLKRVVTKRIYITTVVPRTITTTLEATKYLYPTKTMYKTLYEPKVIYLTVTSTALKETTLTTTITRTKTVPEPIFAAGLAALIALLLIALLALQRRPT
ncbi:MAG: hypothetical protein DRO39_00990 [Thermoprotei archaeon]|nr:MAG: hypothetical protein DRO39_00990 [Thermoprotei archaeon]